MVMILYISNISNSKNIKCTIFQTNLFIKIFRENMTKKHFYELKLNYIN